MTEPDEALIWAIESWGADKARRLALPEAEIEAGVARADALLPDHDGMDQIVVLNRAHAYRAGQAASAERIKALEEVTQNLIAMFDCDDPEVSARAWDEALDEARALLKEPTHD